MMRLLNSVIEATELLMPPGTVLDASGVPYTSRYCTLKNPGEVLSAADLIRLAIEHPPEPVIKGLLNKGDILLLHGSEESFKSVFVLQMAESISQGARLLRHWKVPEAKRVGVIETEIHEVMLGERLAKMFPKAGGTPKNLFFMPESTMREWRRQNLIDKFGTIQQWVFQNDIEVLLIDTANDFFRGAQNPSDERNVGGFFDELRNLKIGARIIVRHDRKKSPEAENNMSSNENIRGSGEWKEDPEAIIALERQDRRTHEVSLEVGKLRYGLKPEPFNLWFDTETFRLTPLPPVIEILSDGRQHSRERILAQCQVRFNIGERKASDMITEQAQFLKETMIGHAKAYAINFGNVEQAQWSQFVLRP